MMLCLDVTDYDRYRIEMARQELAAVKQQSMSDDRAAFRALGRMEVAVESLLALIDEGGAES